MPFGRAIARWLREAKPSEYALAIGLVGSTVVLRILIARVFPETTGFFLLLPAVVTAGVFCETAPTLVATILGTITVAAQSNAQELLVGPFFNQTRVSAALFIPACAVVLWANRRQRHAARAAAMAEAWLGEVFRQVPGAVSILEAPSGRHLLSSTHSNTVLGHPPKRIDTASDMAAYGGLHVDGRPYRPEEYPIVRAVLTGEVVRAEPLRYRRPNGDVADLEVYAGPVRDADGRIVAAVGMAFDVTARVAAIRQLEENEGRFRALAEQLRTALDAGALGLWEMDLATQRVALDARFAEMLGLPPEPRELTRPELEKFIDPTDLARAAQAFDGFVATEDTYIDEVRVRTAANELRWIVSRGRMLTATRKVVGVVSDFTQRREREEALKSALEAREVLMREADHRIKNSLQLVTSLLRLQRNRISDPEARDLLDAAVARVNAVADAHLALQRSADLRFIDVDQMLADLSVRMASLNPALNVQCDAEIGLLLDAEQAIPLGLIVSELLTNALRHAYTPGTSGVVTLNASAESGVLVVAVTDEGSGLPLSGSRSGLGTTVVNSLARQIGATISRNSGPDLGTSISLQLPLKEHPLPPHIAKMSACPAD